MLGSLCCQTFQYFEVWSRHLECHCLFVKYVSGITGYIVLYWNASFYLGQILYNFPYIGIQHFNKDIQMEAVFEFYLLNAVMCVCVHG